MIGHLYRHLKSDEVYMVIGFCVIEATNRPGVLYRAVNSGYDVVWARDRTEFLDGRFVFANPAAREAPKQYHTGFRCFFGSHDLETTSDEAGCFGKCSRCGAEVGFVPHSDLQKDLPPRSHHRMQNDIIRASAPTTPPPPKPKR